MKKLMAAAIFITALAQFTNFLADMGRKDDPMKVCQIDHSYDVCFQALNR